MLLEGPGEVSARLRERCNPAATTIAGYTLDGEGVLWLMAIGDTRAALLREGELTAWTARHNRLDHSRLHGQPVPGGPDAEQALAAQLMRSVNGSETAIPDIQPVAAKRGDVVVVMSDGFEEAAGLAAIREASRVWRGGAAAVVSEAIRQSVHNAGAYVAVRDNATLLVGVVE
jgi:serine/threonine protein phosphatase PrpC